MSWSVMSEGDACDGVGWAGTATVMSEGGVIQEMSEGDACDGVGQAGLGRRRIAWAGLVWDGDGDK